MRRVSFFCYTCLVREVADGRGNGLEMQKRLITTPSLGTNSFITAFDEQREMRGLRRCESGEALER